MFVQLTGQDGKPLLVNLNHVQQIIPLTYSEPVRAQLFFSVEDYLSVREDLDTIARLAGARGLQPA